MTPAPLTRLVSCIREAKADTEALSIHCSSVILTHTRCLSQTLTVVHHTWIRDGPQSLVQVWGEIAEPVTAQEMVQPRGMVDTITQLQEDFTQQQKTMQG